MTDREVLERIDRLRQEDDEWDGTALLDGVRALVGKHLGTVYDHEDLADLERAERGEYIG